MVKFKGSGRKDRSEL